MDTVIKNFFDRSFEEYFNKTLDTFWSECTQLNHKNDPFFSNEFISISKDIHDGNIHLCHQK